MASGGAALPDWSSFSQARVRRSMASVSSWTAAFQSAIGWAFCSGESCGRTGMAVSPTYRGESNKKAQLALGVLCRVEELTHGVRHIKHVQPLPLERWRLLVFVSH